MSEYRKAWIAGLTMALIAGLEVVQKVIPMSDTWRGWITVGLAVGGTFLTWLVPNAGSPAIRQEASRR